MYYFCPECATRLDVEPGDVLIEGCYCDYCGVELQVYDYDRELIEGEIIA